MCKRSELSNLSFQAETPAPKVRPETLAFTHSHPPHLGVANLSEVPPYSDSN